MIVDRPPQLLDLAVPEQDLLRWSSLAVEVSLGWHKTTTVLVRRLLETLHGVVDDARLTQQGVGMLVA
jgi:hypothetical protein